MSERPVAIVTGQVLHVCDGASLASISP